MSRDDKPDNVGGFAGDLVAELEAERTRIPSLREQADGATARRLALSLAREARRRPRWLRAPLLRQLRQLRRTYLCTRRAA